MPENPWYPFYIGDYQQKTSHLSLAEHGAYRLLIDHYMATRHPLPIDHTILYRICRVFDRKERQIIDKIMIEFFSRFETKTGTFYEHKKCDEILAKQLKNSEAQSARAKRGHITRQESGIKNTPINSCPEDAPDMLRARVPEPEPYSKKEKDITPSKNKTIIPDWVPLQLWEDYLEMRKKKRAYPTERAIELIITKLNKWKLNGHDVSKILEKSIINNYTDVFEPKKEINGQLPLGKPKEIRRNVTTIGAGDA